ncbi:MAG: prepilin peptidase [Planctomycetaceae bacterium]|jgi:prepilin peptidase CpaA|nr:prepilin peptidase [Planctomycetaceae bacterium]MBT6486658.1 prepilin peptidase [Planctomycetaceae bacterium]MBT6495949.1 prepilin peptidase [Planctomycetaceae bacterium]
MVLYILLFLLVTVATITDVARHKIYNWNVYPGIILGFVANGFRTVAVPNSGSVWDGLIFSLEGFLACGLIMLVCFVFFDMGGGDVKLVAMMGAFLGVQQGVEAMLWTFVLGSIVGAVILIWQIGVLRLISKSFQHTMLILRARSWVPLTNEERQPLKRWLFLAPSALAAVAIVTTGLFK